MFYLILKILRIFFRGEESKETRSHLEEQNATGNDVDGMSDGTDSTFGRSLGSSSTKDFGLTSNPGEPGSRVCYTFP